MIQPRPDERPAATAAKPRDKDLLMTGFTTNVCVETTARHGYIKGYYIVLVSDCTGAPTHAEYESGVFNIRTGQVSTSDELRFSWTKSRL
jgi:ureidoacrylate peracid hydrolase